MSFHTNSFQEINGEIVKSLDNLKTNKEKISREIESLEEYRDRLMKELGICQAELEHLDNSLQDKHVIFEVYDKILRESDNAYSKIVDSTQALYKMVKNEESTVKYTAKKKK